MKVTRTLGTDLWRALVEKMNQGVLVFSQRGVVIYANNKAAHLLDYTPRDVLELDKGDFVSLCDTNRLDGARFANAFLAEKLGDADGHAFEVATAIRRLSITPREMTLEHGQVTALLMHEVESWRSDLISRTMISEMNGPLTFGIEYATMLSERAKSGSALPYEINDLARIIHESLDRAMRLWELASYLYNTDPRQGVRVNTSQVNLFDAFEQVVRELAEHNHRTLRLLHLELPVDLPIVRASPENLHKALYMLLEQILSRLPADGGSMNVRGRDRQRYVQIDLRIEAPSQVLRSYSFDALPLVIVEQIIQHQGGRIWIRGGSEKLMIISITLPTWVEDSHSNR